MKIIISPSKMLDFDSELPKADSTQPLFLEKSAALIKELQKLHPNDIMDLMEVSSKLANLNFERFQKWHLPFTTENSRQAGYAFNGDVYEGLAFRSLSGSQVDYLQKRLRILSGLYGILRPLDLIQPYRLEMGRKFRTTTAKDLYEYWGVTITDELNLEFLMQENPTLINLASEEYFKAVIPSRLNARVITPVFLEDRGGEKPKVISIMAKRARGSMVRFLAEQNIQEVEDIKTFDYGGYSYHSELSKGDRWVFIR